jgi:hypothetical protein
MDGAISLDDPKFVAATEVCYLVFTGAPLTAAALVLLGGEADLSSNKDSASDLRKMVADERARRSRR